MKGLIIKSPHIEKILEGKKIWELRGSRTKIRGKIALIKSGSKTIVGYAELTSCLEITGNIRATEEMHHASGIIHYERVFAWCLNKVEVLETPIPYKHPQGAIIWVNV